MTQRNEELHKLAEPVPAYVMDRLREIALAKLREKQARQLCDGF